MEGGAQVEPGSQILDTPQGASPLRAAPPTPMHRALPPHDPAAAGPGNLGLTGKRGSQSWGPGADGTDASSCVWPALNEPAPGPRRTSPPERRWQVTGLWQRGQPGGAGGGPPRKPAALPVPDTRRGLPIRGAGAWGERSHPPVRTQPVGRGTREHAGHSCRRPSPAISPPTGAGRQSHGWSPSDGPLPGPAVDGPVSPWSPRLRRP